MKMKIVNKGGKGEREVQAKGEKVRKALTFDSFQSRGIKIIK